MSPFLASSPVFQSSFFSVYNEFSVVLHNARLVGVTKFHSKKSIRSFGLVGDGLGSERGGRMTNGINVKITETLFCKFLELLIKISEDGSGNLGQSEM